MCSGRCCVTPQRDRHSSRFRSRLCGFVGIGHIPLWGQDFDDRRLWRFILAILCKGRFSDHRRNSFAPSGGRNREQERRNIDAGPPHLLLSVSHGRRRRAQHARQSNAKPAEILFHGSICTNPFWTSWIKRPVAPEFTLTPGRRSSFPH